MRVVDLIQALQALPAESRVVGPNEEYGGFYDLGAPSMIWITPDALNPELRVGPHDKSTEGATNAEWVVVIGCA